MEEVREKLQPDYDLWHELLLWAEQSFIFSRIYKAILFLLIFQFRSMLRLFVFSLVIRGWSCFLIGLSEAETLQQEGDRNCLYVWFVAVKKIPDNMCLWIVMINELIEDYLPMVAMGLFRHFVMDKFDDNRKMTMKSQNHIRHNSWMSPAAKRDLLYFFDSPRKRINLCKSFWGD